MAFEKYTFEEMDDFGEEAALELHRLSKESEITPFANWFAKWYMKAGYKRLGRKILEYKTQDLDETEE